MCNFLFGLLFYNFAAEALKLQNGWKMNNI